MLRSEAVLTAETPASVSPPRVLSRSRWWTPLSVVLVVIGLVLAPVAVAAHWASTELGDTDHFAATFAPLADDPSVQSFMADEIITAIDSELNVNGITDRAFDGIDSLGLPLAASSALGLLRRPAVSGITSLVDDTVRNFVASDAFSNVFARALRTTHSQLGATLSGVPDAAVSIGDSGQVSIELGPVIAAVKTVLVEQGLTFAGNLPGIDRSIVVAQADRASALQTVYALGVGGGVRLPWVSLAFLAAGVLVARRR